MFELVSKRAKQASIARLARVGFTLAEVMVAVAIIALIASISVPNLMSYVDNQRITSSKAAIDSVVAGIARFEDAIGRYPSALTHLTEPISTSGGGNTINTRNSCTGLATASGFYTNTQVASWGNNGPFFTMPLSTEGYPIPIGTFDNTIVRSPSSGTNTAGELWFSAPDVRVEDIEALELLYDPSVNSTTGVIRRGASVDNYATLTYVFKMRGC